jgi:hypothetical protein
LDINDACRKIEAWRRHYNGNTFHTALCDMTPDGSQPNTAKKRELPTWLIEHLLAYRCHERPKRPCAIRDRPGVSESRGES